MNSNSPEKGGQPDSEKSPIQKSVLAKIQQREVQMRPRIFFLLRIAGVIVLTLFVLTLSILIANFIFFTLRLNGHDSLLSFGGAGILLFLYFFPWYLLLLDAVAIFLLWLLVRQFKFGYKSPWLYALLVLLCVSIVGGALLDRGTPLNDALIHQADLGRLPPPLGVLYLYTRQPPAFGSGEYRGTIVSIQGSTFVLASYHMSSDQASPEAQLGNPPQTQSQNPQQATTTLITVEKPTHGPDATEPLSVGESVLVAGHMHDGVVQAFGIHQLDDVYGLPPAQPLPPQ